MKKLVLNPFERFAGATSLGIGVAGLLLTAVIACSGNIHLDGVLDLHMGSHVAFIICLAEGAINWLSFSVFIYIAGLLFSKSSIRSIDVFGTQAMARLPMGIACIFSWLLYDTGIEQFFMYTTLHQGSPVTISGLQWLAFGVSTLLTLTCIVWMVALMYKAYSVSCNVKGGKAIVSFVVCLLVAETCSKLLMYFMF